MRSLFFVCILYSLVWAQNISFFEPVEAVKEYDRDKVALGRKLFFDPILSKDNTVSCASCHFRYGADTKRVSTGVDEKKGRFNTPTVFNSRFNYRNHWDGSVKSLYEQIDRPVTTDFEMAASEAMITRKLQENSQYSRLFEKVYGTKPTYDLVKDALVAFEKTLVTPSKFDRYLQGEVSLGPKEQAGLEVFKSYGCVSCHNGKNLGGNSMQRFGTVIPTRDSNTSQLDRVRVPSLRNVAKTGPYFHDGSVDDLSKAIKLMGYHNLGSDLNAAEIEQLEAFLQTLTGKIPQTWSEDE